jgi:streptomycin 6-kinase
MDKLRERLQLHAREWRVNLEETFETETSLLAFGTREEQRVVLKVVKEPEDEWHSGQVLAAFAGQGFAKVYEYALGAMLLERLQPGHSLVELAMNGREEEATEIVAGLLQRMPVIDERQTDLANCPPIEAYSKGFERYLASGDRRISKSLVETAQGVFIELCATQHNRRLLHGDFQHYNVLFDSQRGWLAIDPKGVFGELEYEIGAIIRNPIEAPEVFLSASCVDRRLKHFAGALQLDFDRMLDWTFAQSVLSAIWEVEDGHSLDPTSPILRLAVLLKNLTGR